jgi:hypothetical protein
MANLPSTPIGGGYAPPVQAPVSQPFNPPPVQQPASNGNWFSNMSPETQGALVNTGTNLLGGYLSQRNQNQQNQQAQSFQAQQNTQQQQAELQKLQMQLEQSRILQEKQMGLQAAQAAPQRQDWRQRQALLAAILPELQNYSVQAPGRLSQYQPQMSGGFRLPEGGIPQEALQFFSPQARLTAEQDFDRQAAMSSGGRMATPDYGAAGYGDALGIPATENVNNYTQSILQEILKQQPTAGGQSPASPFLQGQAAPRHLG